MRIHENEHIEQVAIQTIVGMQLGLTEEDVLMSIDKAEELEMYEECQGMVMGLEYYKTKDFGCKVGNINFNLDA